MNWTREERFLTSIASQRLDDKKITCIRNELREGFDWSLLVNRAMQEGVASMFYVHARDLGLFVLMPQWVEERLKDVYHQTVFHNLKILGFLNELGEVLKKRQVSVIVLQGASLLKDVYKDIGIRPMEDVDLMVSPVYKTALKEVIEKMGYRRDATYPDTYRKGIIYIDLHADPLSSERIGARKWIMNIDQAHFWDSAIPLLRTELPILRLSPYDNLIALSWHLLKHNLTRIMWFADIREAILKEYDALNWEEFAAYCRAVGGDRCVLYIMILLKNLFCMEMPGGILSYLGRERLSPVEKFILRLRLANEHPGFLPQLLWLFQIRQREKRILFVWENIFPGKEVMNQIFPSYPPSFFSSLRRLIGICSHGLCDFFSALRVAAKGSLPPL